MGNWNCNFQDSGHLAAVARDFCPFPDYSPSPLLNMLSANSSVLLSEHYAAVQASLTPQQQQDFTQTLRSTFGREGKVSYGAVGVVALSLAVLFDTVSRQVKGEHVSDKEPIPGLFLRDPRGTYPPPVHTVSRYLRLVPHIANNPTRMRDDTEKYFHELDCVAILGLDTTNTTQWREDVVRMNYVRCYLIKNNMMLHVKHIFNKTLDVGDLTPSHNNQSIDLFDAQNVVLSLSCDPKESSERLLAKLDSFGNRTQEAFKKCVSAEVMTVMENIAALHWFLNIVKINIDIDEEEFQLPQTPHFDLKASALGKWI